MKDLRLYIEAVFATMLVFVFIWLLFVVFSLSVKPLNFIANSLKEVHLSDIYFSHIQEQKVDTNIILVNIGELSRKDIASLIDIIASKEPQVIGLDVLFSRRFNDVQGLDSIKRVSAGLEDIIVFSSFFNIEDQRTEEEFYRIPLNRSGHINLISNPQRTEPVRYFHPTYISLDGDTIHSFAAKISSVIAPAQFEYLNSRASDKKIINYFGSSESFRIFEGYDILNRQKYYSPLVEDKIVLMGFLGAGKFNKLHDLSDKYYSPLNKTFFGRSHPDIYGLVIHANILKMILDQNYIDRPANWIINPLTFIIVYLHMLPFLYFFVRQHLWYHIAAKLIQLFSLALIVASIFFFMDQYRVLPDLTYLFLAVFLSVDLLYLYEAIVVLAYRFFGWKSYFIKDH